MKNAYGPQNWLQMVENGEIFAGGIFGVWIQDVNIQRDEKGYAEAIEHVSAIRINKHLQMVHHHTNSR